MPQYHNHDGSFKSGVDEASVIRQWVDAFKQKREQLASGRCEWKEKPADLTAIDNPMGLATAAELLHCQAFLTGARADSRSAKEVLCCDDLFLSCRLF